VLDPFIGSGTTALAASILGRKYIGFDICDEYIKIAQEKIKNAE
jgi:DNA modification methylase